MSTRLLYFKFREAVANLLKGGFFHIVGAGTINKAFSALLGIILVRLLSQEEYGVYSYAQNIMSFFLLFNGLGAAPAILQLCSAESKPVQYSFYRYGFKKGCLFDCAVAVVMLAIGLIVSFPIAGSGVLFSCMCFYPLLSLIIELRLTKLRTELRNRDYSQLTNIQTISNVFFSVTGAFLFGVGGLIAGQYIAILTVTAIACIRYPLKSTPAAQSLTLKQRRTYWKIALTQSLNNGLSQALSLLSVFFVGLFLSNERDLALYKAATLIPMALAFVPSMIAVYVYPLFASHRKDRPWTTRAFIHWSTILVIIMGIICAVCCLASHALITILFGADYVDAVVPFCILMIGSFVMNSAGRLAGNLLVSQMKLFANTIIAVVSIAVNVVLSVNLIPLFGIMGAAWAWSGTMILMGFLTLFAYCVAICHIKEDD